MAGMRQDNLGRQIVEFECGAIWLCPTPGQALYTKECPTITKGWQDLKDWINTVR
jgi:hypothetical protein